MPPMQPDVDQWNVHTVSQKIHKRGFDSLQDGTLVQRVALVE